MKLFITLFFSFLFSSWAHATAVICPIEGDIDNCYEVDAVFMFGEWIDACCGEFEVFPGWECVQDDCYLAKGNSSKNPDFPTLTAENAYVRFTSGYTTWAVVNNEPLQFTKRYDFGLETMRLYLPGARQLFLANPNLQKLSFIHADNFVIIVERPEKEVNLKQKIIFPDLKKREEEFEKGKKERAEKNLTVKPNPVEREIEIQFKDQLRIKKLEISTTDGSYVGVKHHKTPVAISHYNVLELAPAIYFIKITDEYGRDYLRKFQRQ